MNIIYICVDTLRADHVGAYGYAKPTTPNIDRLASDGAVFLNSYPTDVPTQPSYTSVFTGKKGTTTGVVTHGHPESIIDGSVATFPQVLAQAGHLTAAVSTLYRFRRWFAQGFEHYIQPDMGTWLQHITADKVNQAAIPWLKAYGGSKKDFFLFMHYWDPHTPYNLAPEKYVKKFYQGDPYSSNPESVARIKANPVLDFCARLTIPEYDKGLTDWNYTIAQYDAEINYADEHIGQIISTLEEMNILDDTMILITADHGEALGEHDVYADHWDVYEPTARVPLIIYYPGQVKARKIEALVQHTDFAPTILEAFGVSTPEDMEGKSLWPLLRGKTDQHHEIVTTSTGLWEAQRSLRKGKWKLIKTIDRGFIPLEPASELYDLENDPWETNNLAGSEKDMLADMEREYHRWLEENLQMRPDPLRLAARLGVGTRRVLEEWERIQRQENVTPPTRAEIDNEPVIPKEDSVW